ncbi:MAG: hypothetical protein IJU96_07355 [Clostridia bacterium]|nr:hypothetical protein [Clostridia bacterium]
MPHGKRFFALFLAVVLLLTALPCYAVDGGATYYVDSVNGSDENSGTSQAQAFRTVEKLKTLTLTPGAKVLFRRGGSYPCELTLTCSGTKENPIVLSAYGDEALGQPRLYTDKPTEVLRLFDCSYVTVSELEITAHNGGGIWIDALQNTSVGITLTGLTMHDMQNYVLGARDNLSAGAAGARACVMVKGLPARSRFAVNDLTITDCEMYDCGNGISLWGSWNEEQTPWCEEEDIDPIFNTGALVENVYFHDMDAESIIVGICDGALVTHCRSIDCCQADGLDENGEVKYFNASMWFWGSVNSTIEYCEIAGQKNVGDGMSVDFDSYSHHCTYQYIYSHDNQRFCNNNPNHSGHHGNTVRYCLSLNDNGGSNRLGGGAKEYGMRFYNNTIVNCRDFDISRIPDGLVANNIFAPLPGYHIRYDLDAKKQNTLITHNCYYNTLVPIVDKHPYIRSPGFASDNLNDPESFRLVAGSPLIGGGIDTDCELTQDFFGNDITSCNIGCYGSSGVSGRYPKEDLLIFPFRYLRVIFLTLKVMIAHEINKRK